MLSVCSSRRAVHILRPGLQMQMHAYAQSRPSRLAGRSCLFKRCMSSITDDDDIAGDSSNSNNIHNIPACTLDAAELTRIYLGEGEGEDRKRVLLVGEGDLGFARTLAHLLPPPMPTCTSPPTPASLSSLVATTWHDETRLVDCFTQSADNIAALLANSEATILYGVDATALHLHQEVLSGSDGSDGSGGRGFDTVAWNFPHSDGKANVGRNRLLLLNFLSSVRNRCVTPSPSLSLSLSFPLSLSLSLPRIHSH